VTQYELLDLFNSSGMNLLTTLFAFISATSAFIAVAYFSTTSLSVRLYRIAAAPHSFIALCLTVIMFQFGRSLISIHAQMPSAGLDWHASASEPPFILPTFMYSSVVIMIFLYLGALRYFHHSISGDEEKC
jgi:cytochrome bd-type quinol oxidase subunit 1